MEENNFEVKKSFSKKGKRQLTFLFVCCMVMLLSVFGYTYSYFSATKTDVNKTDTVLRSNALGLTFRGTSEVVDCSNIIPGDKCIKEFEVENTSEVTTTYNIYMENVTNGFNEDLVYTLTEGENTVVAEKPTPETKEGKTYIAANIEIAGKAKKEYVLTVEYKYSATKNQNVNNGKSFKTRVGIDTAQGIAVGKYSSKIMTYDSTAQYISNYEGTSFWEHREDATKIIIQTEQNEPATYAYRYDASDAGDGSVMVYYVANNEDPAKYTMYIQSDGKLELNENSQFLFGGFVNVTEIQGLNNVITTNVTNMASMLSNLNSITSLDLSSFDTANVTDMSGMFSGYNGATLNVNHFDTSKVTTLGGTFSNCNVVSLDLSNWNTASATYMGGMFSGANIEELNISNFVSDASGQYSGMFAGATKLKNIDMRSFEFSKTSSNNLGGMFSGVPSTVKIKVKNAAELSTAASLPYSSLTTANFEIAS